jgi:hypothetical protein
MIIWGLQYDKFVLIWGYRLYYGGIKMFEPEEMYYAYVPDEVTAKISEIIREELNNRLGDDLEELNRLRQSDKEKQNKIYELHREVKKIQEEYDKKLKTVLLEKEKEVKRSIFHGFTMGDKVYFIDYKFEYHSCLSCKETGKVQVTINSREEEIKCPHCDGNKRNSKTVYYARKGTISEVDFKTWHDESEKCTEVSFYVKPDDGRDSRKEYLIYKTEEEAIKECEKRNNK